MQNSRAGTSGRLGRTRRMGRTSPVRTQIFFADANDRDDRKSYSGYVFMLGQSTICWRSRKQRCVTTSTTEAEFLALSAAAKQQMWLQLALRELGHDHDKPMLFCDNKSAVDLVRNPIISDRSKHIDVVYHHVRDLYGSARLDIQHVPGSGNPADICTKPLPAPRLAMLAMLRCMVLRDMVNGGNLAH